MGEFLEDWLAAVKRNLRPKTFDRYREIVAHHLVPALGNHVLSQLKAVHIDAAWNAALASGRRNGKGGLSAQTVKHHHRVLSQALKRAVRRRLLVRNPAADVDPPRPQRHEMAILSPDETKRFLKDIEHTRLHTPVLLAVTTGMRRGEFMGLRWRDTDLVANTLSVTQVLEQTNEGFRFQPPKTARSRRQIDLPLLTVEALHRHKERQAEDHLRLGLGRPEHDLVVCRANGKPMQPRSLTHEFTRLVKRADVPRVRFHDLRHAHISHLMLNGESPKLAAERAGHASVSITLDVYSHLLPGMHQDAARRIDELLRDGVEG